MLPGGRRATRMIYDMFPRLDLCYTHPARHIIPAGQDLQGMVYT